MKIPWQVFSLSASLKIAVMHFRLSLEVKYIRPIGENGSLSFETRHPQLAVLTGLADHVRTLLSINVIVIVGTEDPLVSFAHILLGLVDLSGGARA